MSGIWLGRRLRELWAMPRALAVAALLAALLAVKIAWGLSLLPPSIGDSSLQIASAGSQVLIDTPRSAVADLREDTTDLRALSNRAVLVGTVMASPQVREFIARNSGVPVERIRAIAPATPDHPEALAGPAERAVQTTDLLEAPDEYRLEIAAKPTVPILDLYAEAPTPEAATGLLDAAVAGLDDYLGSVADERGTPARDRVAIEQLGRPVAAPVNPGGGFAIAALVFMTSLVLLCAGLLGGRRLAAGWRERPPAPAGDLHRRPGHGPA